MPAEITSAVHLVTDLPDGAELRTEIGSITVAVHPDGVDLGEIRTMLAGLMTEAAAYLLTGGDLTDLPQPTPGVGESPSPG
ncbi:hypothetical protein [Streptomyces europaeiscabiei]|uniref:hypothetical protein n=1 Tax=Streptomyces europaeiscabiei TaxID=146819 RepID=UPI0029AFE957|nr:hypothetical protein [Streptomyces europaeiscabiei]MDX3839037.1 hypothetical protein [Streptomyces europaeiscabiei]